MTLKQLRREQLNLSFISHGEITVYVDDVNGTDDDDHGSGPATAAFKTIQFAIDSLPCILTGNVTIHVAAGTYNESVIIQGKYFTGDYRLTLVAAETVVRTTTSVKSGTAGSRTAAATVYINATLTTNQYMGKWIKWSDTTATASLQGKRYLIFWNSNVASNSQIGVVGAWETGFGVTPTTSDQFTIVDCGVVITGTATVAAGQPSVVFDGFRFTDKVTIKDSASANMNYCSFRPVSTVGLVVLSAVATLEGCYGYMDVNGRLIFIQAFSRVNVRYSYFRGDNITSSSLIDCTGGLLNNDSTTVFLSHHSGSGAAILVRGNGAIGFYSATNETLCRIEYCTKGINAVSGGQATYVSTAYVAYTGNTNDTVADLASFGYIS